MLAADLPFLEWQLTSFPFKAVVCTSKTVYDNLQDMFEVSTSQTGNLNQVDWYVGIARVNNGEFGLVGWNKTLAHAGLRAEEQVELGRVLRRELEALAVLPHSDGK